jgi:ubiquinone/menaquinone biosynthesis C-methylase UbiE
MYNRSAILYDAIYRAQGKDYSAEAKKICALIKRYQESEGNSLLDLACGTGNHIGCLQDVFELEGLDNSREMVDIARQKFPNFRFHLADMVDFEIDHRFDVITCLFSAIGYTATVPQLTKALNTIYRHIKPGGVTIIEPWFAPGVLENGTPHAVFVDEPELKIARMNVNRMEENISYLDFHYLVATPRGVEVFCETHLLGLFTDEEYQQAFRTAGFEVFHDPEGLDGRGLYIGVRPQK